MLTKVHLVKAKACPVVMYGYESWTKKKIEHRRIDAFQLWFSKRLMTVPWTAGRSNQSILNKTSSEHSLERLTLALKLHYFGHRIRRADSLEKTLMLGKVEVRRRREWQRMRWLDGITDSMNVSWARAGRWWRTGKPGVLRSMGPHRIRTERLNNNRDKWRGRQHQFGILEQGTERARDRGSGRSQTVRASVVL